MVVEEKSKRLDKRLYTIEIKLLKILPSLVALIYFINTVLSAIKIDLPILSYIGGMSFIPLLFMYLSSYVFKFCEYHRIPLHYILFNNVFSIICYTFDIFMYVNSYIVFHSILFGICLFVILYLKSRSNEKCNNQFIGKITQ